MESFFAKHLVAALLHLDAVSVVAGEGPVLAGGDLQLDLRQLTLVALQRVVDNLPRVLSHGIRYVWSR